MGWISSLVLVATLSRQLYTQWKARSVEAVSKWLYVGQFVAEIGFIIYSWSVRNWIFVFTNVILLLENILGLWMLIFHRRQVRNKTSLAA